MIVYADFASANCYLASVRVDRLIESGYPAPDWRAVEHRPGLPPAGFGLSGPARAVRCHTLVITRQILQPGEKFEARNTAFLPNTRAAITAFAEAYGAGVADQARRALFDAYWVRGVNIGDPEILRTLLRPILDGSRPDDGAAAQAGCAAGSPGAPHGAHLRVSEWQEEWLRLATPIDLTLVGPHLIECGRSALLRLASARVLAA